jgi:RNA polymerase sigma factor (sigma-70 family)
MDSTGFRALLERARGGEPAAGDRLLVLVRLELERRARRFAGPTHADASVSDLIQSVWVRAWQKLDQFQPAGDDAETLARFQAWLGQIMRRLRLNAARYRAAERRRPPGRPVLLDQDDRSGQAPGRALPTNEPSPSSRARTGEEIGRVQQALQQLVDPIDREIMRLRFGADWSLRQIAEQLQLSPDRVRQRYHAVLRHLERQLGGWP